MGWYSQHKSGALFWFRIFGRGLSVRKLNHKNFNAPFSERCGHDKKYLDILGYRFKALKNSKWL